MELAAAFQAAPLYAIYDTQLSGTLDCGEAVAAWLRAGIRVIQYRHKSSFTRENFAACEATARLVRQAGARFIVNDRADAALLAGADGVHVGQTDLAPSDVRKLLPPPALVGHSTHNLAQLASTLAQPIDYAAIGPVFATASKQNPDPTIGLEMVRRARALTQLPLVAIGGITQENLTEVLRAGADAVALIGGLVSGCDDAIALEARARHLLLLAVTARA